MPGAGLLGLVRRFWQTGRAMARCVNRIARQRLEGQDLSRMAPAGFDATLTNAFVVKAVAFTAALRERLLALAGRPVAPLAPGLPKPERAPRGLGASYHDITYEVPADERHDWAALAKPWRMGPGGVAVALRMIAGKSDREVVTAISDYLRRAAAQLGAEADLPRIAALEAAARALCPDVDVVPEGGSDPGGSADDGPQVLATDPRSDGADGDPPLKKPPD